MAEKNSLLVAFERNKLRQTMEKHTVTSHILPQQQAQPKNSPEKWNEMEIYQA